MPERLLSNAEKWVTVSYVKLILTTLLVSPLLLWALLDQGLWKGDPVGYAYKIVCQYQEMTSNFFYWVLSQFVGYKGPFIFWVGQFLIPLGKLIGNINFALLLLPISAYYISVYLMFCILEQVFKDISLTLFGSLLMSGSPLFFGLTTGFWIEPLQVMIVVAWMYAILQIQQLRFWPSAALFIILGSLALLIKVATPMYLIAPAIVYVTSMFRKTPDYSVQKQDGWLFIFADILAIPTLVFYLYNLKPLIEFAFFAASSPLFGGSDTQIQLMYSGLSNGIFLWGVFFLFLITLSWALWRRWSGGRIYGSKVLVNISFFQIGLFLVLWLCSSNGDSRYFLPVLPYFVLLFTWSLKQIGKKSMIALSLVLAVIQYVLVVGYSFGLSAQNPAYGMIRPLIREQTLDKNVVQTVINLVAEDKRFVVDLEPEISLAEIQYELSKGNMQVNWNYNGKSVNNFFNFYNQQIDTNDIDLEKVLKNVYQFSPEYYITWASRLDTALIRSEIHHIDKYNACTVPHRWAIAERIFMSALYDDVPIGSDYGLLILKRR